MQTKSDVELTEPNSRGRLSIKHLMVWSLGVAVAITVVRVNNVLKAYAEQALSPGSPLSIQEEGPAGLIIAAGYGTGLSLAWFAIFGGAGFWRDPGRILVTLMASIACLDLMLSGVVFCYVTAIKVERLAGVNFRSFAGTYGYTSGVFISLFVLIRSRTRWNWRIGWLGILLFSGWQSAVLLVATHDWFTADPRFFGFQSFIYANWALCFLIGTSTGCIGVLFAVLVDLYRRESISWLVIVSVSVFTLMWCAGNARLLVG